MQGSLRWLSVAFIEYKTRNNKTILFDPWTSSNGNRLCPYANEDFKNIDLILVSHDHHDHVGSAATLTQLTAALLGGPDETMQRLISEEGVNPEQVVNNGNGYIVGGGAVLPWVKIVAVPALHTSRTSAPIGTIVQLEDGTSIYHAGDTAITAEMEIFARLYPVDVAILPIFGIATMDCIQASEAVRLIRPKIVMPIHFDFCEAPEETLHSFIELCEKQNPEVNIIKTELDTYYTL